MAHLSRSALTSQLLEEEQLNLASSVHGGGKAYLEVCSPDDQTYINNSRTCASRTSCREEPRRSGICRVGCSSSLHHLSLEPSSPRILSVQRRQANEATSITKQAPTGQVQSVRPHAVILSLQVINSLACSRLGMKDETDERAIEAAERFDLIMT